MEGGILKLAGIQFPDIVVEVSAGGFFPAILNVFVIIKDLNEYMLYFFINKAFILHFLNALLHHFLFFGIAARQAHFHVCRKLNLSMAYFLEEGVFLESKKAIRACDISEQLDGR